MSLIDDLKARYKARAITRVPRLSLKAEADYVRALYRVAQAVFAEVENAVVPKLPDLYDRSTWPQLVDSLIRGAGSHLELQINPTFIATPWARAVQIAADNQWEATLKRAFGVDVEALINPHSMQPFVDNSVSENIRLIKSIPAEHLSKVEQIIRNGRDQNKSVAAMAREIREVEPVTKRRAKLIAQDQSQKLAATINQQRQKEAGVDSYIWKGMMDGRERPLHVARERMVFSWSDAPSDGHPGQPVMCRCHALPNFDDIPVGQRATT